MTSPDDPHTKYFPHTNGPTQHLFDRFAVAELCRGWPMFRDNSEWANFRALFVADGDAYVWTTWSGAQSIDAFIALSKQAKAAGAFTLHRENGTMVALEPAADRAVGKMKATITQRFVFDGTEYDVDCDCRYLFFCLRDLTSPGGRDWRVKYVRIIYEKDKVCPVDGKAVPHFSDEELARYPDGYRYLGASQARLGNQVHADLVTMKGHHWNRIYGCMERWLAGEDPSLFWDEGRTI
ncbi:hypothetical protein Purlil1_11280 [Purpureocillium lilacinum]|uniref:SnoaL-like domain-containing protein n=1 Tax=Purpureocillium lilacinum TaxID=33203 RepID=A0ABR0BK85_PURLI|nr:hypothetical protein Purlil1_11280 [Purpureocillium lilacinum]